ncbi:hypothetical protein THAOC_08614 [Thalassiosira oceanica]|uniref:AP2/ERF domain-containing protein n=1 Tax=Thalassiosira oceanica TaxID=159749 RepID=K0SXC0_THAOC|nr:hypothetical protein THAOC_08614 [Thalassiosira oceanica]|eukprot:EJK70065.1 hypothetical protein THAOC_08614 [Thalassiosira oceanica]
MSHEEFPTLGTSRKRERSESPVAARQVSEEAIGSASGSGDESGGDERKGDEIIPTRNKTAMRKNAEQRSSTQNPLAKDDSGRSSRRGGRSRKLNIDYRDRIYSKSVEPVNSQDTKSRETRRPSTPFERPPGPYDAGGKNLKSDEMSDQDTPPGSEIHPSKLKVSTRILILYKSATLYKGTILNRRFTDKGDEYLVHYDGNKKSNQKWVAGTNIRGLIEDESGDEDGTGATGSSAPQIERSSAGSTKLTKVDSPNAKPVGTRGRGGVRPGAGRKYVNGKAVNTGYVPDEVSSSPSARRTRQMNSSVKSEGKSKKKSPRLKKNNPEFTDADGVAGTLRRKRSPGRSSREMSVPDAVRNLSKGEECDEDGNSAHPKKRRRLFQRRSHVEMLMADEFKESTRRPTRSESVDFSREMALAKRSASQIKRRRNNIDMLLADDAARRVSELSFSSSSKKDPKDGKERARASVAAKTKRKPKKCEGRPKMCDGELPPLDEMPGSEVDTTGLSEDSRVLVLYRGVSLYRATVQGRRRRLINDSNADEEDEFLVHYDGNKKTNLKWVRAVLIRGLLDDDDKLIQEKPIRRISRATRAKPKANSPRKRSTERPLKSDDLVKKSPSSRGITQRTSGKWQVQVYYAGKSRYIGVFNSEHNAATAYKVVHDLCSTYEEFPSSVQVEQNVKAMRGAACAATNTDMPKYRSRLRVGLNDGPISLKGGGRERRARKIDVASSSDGSTSSPLLSDDDESIYEEQRIFFSPVKHQLERLEKMNDKKRKLREKDLFLDDDPPKKRGLGRVNGIHQSRKIRAPSDLDPRPKRSGPMIHQRKVAAPSDLDARSTNSAGPNLTISAPKKRGPGRPKKSLMAVETMGSKKRGPGRPRKSDQVHSRTEDDSDVQFEKVGVTERPSRQLLHFIRALSPSKQRSSIAKGLRVKVRFADNNWYGGIVASSSQQGSLINIHFDDGTMEECDFPDRDVIVDDVGNGRHRQRCIMNASTFAPPDESERQGDLKTPPETQKL